MAEDLCVALVPIFSKLTREQQVEVAQYARPVGIDRGEYLMHAGERHPALFVVHHGQVKLRRTSEDGRETIVQVLGPGEVGGEIAFITGSHPEDDAVAMEPSQMCVFDHRHVATLVHRFPDVGVAMLHTLAERLASARRMLAARTVADVGARVAAYLLDCPASWSAAGRASVRLPMAKKDIATYLGTSAETLSRRLAAFERDGLIEVRGAVVDILDPDELDRRSRGS